MTTFAHSPDYSGLGAVGGTLEIEGSTIAPQVDATLVVPINEGISVGGVGMVDHSSNRSVTSLTDYNADPEIEVTTEYSTLQTDYKAGALFLIEAFGLDIGGTAAFEGSTSPVREKFDWTEDSTTTVYEAFDTFDDSTYREEQDGNVNVWDGWAVFGASFTPFEQVTLGIDTGTSFNGSGSGRSDSLPTGATIYALSDLLDSSNWSFSGSANMQVRLN